MSLKFSCPNCGVEIISKYLQPGDILICRNCNYEIKAPSEAAVTEDESNILKKLKAESDEIKKYHYEDKKLENDTDEVSKEPTPWGIFSVFKFLIANLFLIIVSSCFIGFISVIIVMAINPGAFEDKELFKKQLGEITANIMSFAFYIIAVGLVYYSVVKRHHHNFFEGLHIYKVSKEHIIKYAKIAAFIVFSVAVIAAIISFTPLQSFIPENVPLDEYIGDTYGKLILFTIFALIAPFAEEIIFRGYIFKGLQNRMGSIWAGIVVTVIFILVHGPQLAFSVVLLSLISIVSVVLIYIRIRTDNLTNCIIVHQIYNFILVAIMWIVFLTVGFEAKV